jgi:chromosomal replication initiation ATPase DnaA
MADGNIWTEILGRLKADLDDEEYRRWFSNSSYAGDSGDQISVWVPTVADGRQILQNYSDRLNRALGALGRGDTIVRFLATGDPDDDEDEVVD